MVKVKRTSALSQSTWIEVASLIGCKVEFQKVPECDYLIDVYTDNSKDVDRLKQAESMLNEVESKYDKDGNFLGLLRVYSEDEVKDAVNEPA